MEVEGFCLEMVLTVLRFRIQVGGVSGAAGVESRPGSVSVPPVFLH